LRRAIVALLASLFSIAAHAQPWTFQGDFFDGLRAERSADGTMHFLPGVVAARPASPGQRSAIEAVIERVRQRAELPGVRVWSSTINPDAAVQSALRNIVNTCQAEAPYRLDSGKIRVGWLCDGRLSWFMGFDFSGDRVSEILVVRALVPPLPPLPPPPPRHH